jgi:hypothetical protein
MAAYHSSGSSRPGSPSRPSVSPNSVMVITPEASFSITSTVFSTAGAASGFIRRTFFRSAFFTGGRLGLFLAIARFVAFLRPDVDALRALPRTAAPFLRRTFDRFFRLAVIDPFPIGVRRIVSAAKISRDTQAVACGGGDLILRQALLQAFAPASSCRCLLRLVRAIRDQRYYPAQGRHWIAAKTVPQSHK